MLKLIIGFLVVVALLVDSFQQRTGCIVKVRLRKSTFLAMFWGFDVLRAPVLQEF